MISDSAFWSVSAVSLGLVLSPGPNMVYLISRSVTQGRRAGLISLLGVIAGFLAYLIAVTAGIATILAVVPAVYTAIRFAGAAYLLHLAWKAVRPGGVSAFSPKQLANDPPRRLFAMGLITNLLNPKIAILYLSLIPQFVEPDRGYVALQSVLLGLVQITIAGSVNGLIVLTAGSVAAFLEDRPGWLRAQRYFMGTALTAIAGHILLVG